MTPPVSSMVDGAKVAECYKGRMVLGGSAESEFRGRYSHLHTHFSTRFRIRFFTDGPKRKTVKQRVRAKKRAVSGM